MLGRDTLWRQLSGECIRQSAEEGIAARADGDHAVGVGVAPENAPMFRMALFFAAKVVRDSCEQIEMGLSIWITL